jgi:hypothetical protein
MCIRALDDCPPVDLTFGEFLRALITADMDLMPEDRRRYRVAFIEAFRRRGIYPRNVRTLSEDSLRWSHPGEDPTREASQVELLLKQFIDDVDLRAKVGQLRHDEPRRSAWQTTRGIKKDLHDAITEHAVKADIIEWLTGLALSPTQIPAGVKIERRGGRPRFQVHAMRAARRQKEDGRELNQAFITILQRATWKHAETNKNSRIRCGSTLVVDLDDSKVTYAIRKGLRDHNRFENMVQFLEGQADSASLAATYFAASREPFAALHHLGA